MTLILWSNIDYQGVGKIYYPEFEGILPVYLWNTLYNDFLDSGVSVFTSQYTLCFRVTPVIKITSPLDSLSFYSAPDARYKFGSYSYFCGFEETIIGDTRTLSEIPEHFSYLVYPRQFLDTRWCSVQNTQPGDDVRLVDFGDSSPSVSVDTEVFLAVDVFRAFPRNTGVTGLIINLSEGVSAEMVIFYWLDIINYSNSDTRPLFTYNL